MNGTCSPSSLRATDCDVGRVCVPVRHDQGKHDRIDVPSVAAKTVNGAFHGFAVLSFLTVFLKVDEVVATRGAFPKMKPLLALSAKEGLSGAKIVGTKGWRGGAHVGARGETGAAISPWAMGGTLRLVVCIHCVGWVQCHKPIAWRVG